MPDPIPLDAFDQVRQQLTPVLVYLDRLRVRLELRGYVHSDPMLRAVLDARDRMQALTVELHYASCASGVGRAE